MLINLMASLVPTVQGSFALPSNITVNGSTHAGLRFKTNGKYDRRISNVSYVGEGDWLLPNSRVQAQDYSIYVLVVSLNSGSDPINEWVSLGDVEREWFTTGLDRLGTIYLSFGQRSGTTIGAFDQKTTFTFDVT